MEQYNPKSVKELNLGELEVRDVIAFNGRVLVLIQIDRAKEEVIAKYFKTYGEAIEFIHDESLERNPKGHETECWMCKELRRAKARNEK